MNYWSRVWYTRYKSSGDVFYHRVLFFIKKKKAEDSVIWRCLSKLLYAFVASSLLVGESNHNEQDTSEGVNTGRSLVGTE